MKNDKRGQQMYARNERHHVVLKEGAPLSQETACELEQHVERLKPRYIRITGGVDF